MASENHFFPSGLLESNLSVCLSLLGNVRLIFTSLENLEQKRRHSRDTVTLRKFSVRVASANSVCPFLGRGVGSWEQVRHLIEVLYL